MRRTLIAIGCYTILLALANACYAFTSSTTVSLSITTSNGGPANFLTGETGTTVTWTVTLSGGHAIAGSDGECKIFRNDGRLCFTLKFGESDIEKSTTSIELDNKIPNTTGLHQYKAQIVRQGSPTPIASAWVDVNVANADPWSLQFSNAATGLVELADAPYTPGSSFTGFTPVRNGFAFDNAHWMASPGANDHPSPLVCQRGTQAWVKAKFGGKGPITLRAKPQSMCGGSDSQSGSFAYTGAYAEYTYQLLNNFPNYVTKDTASLYWQAQAHGRPHETWKDIGTSTFNRYLCNGAPKNGRSAQLYRLTCDWASGKSNDDDVFDAVWYGIKTGDDGYVYYPFSFDEGMPVIWETADVISHHLGRCGGFMSYMQDCLSVQSVSSKATAFTVDGQRSPTLYCFRTSTTARGGRTNHQTDFSDHAAMCQLTGGTITMVYDPSYGVARTSELAYETDAITLYYGNSTSELTNYPTAPPNPNPSGNPAGINWIRTAP